METCLDLGENGSKFLKSQSHRRHHTFLFTADHQNEGIFRECGCIGILKFLKLSFGIDKIRAMITPDERRVTMSCNKLTQFCNEGQVGHEL